MQRRQQKAIKSIVRIFKRQKTRTMPDRQAIRAYFYNLPQQQQRHLEHIDYSRSNANQPNHRCHTLGVAIGRQCFIWAVRQCNWIPNWNVIEDLIKRVINFQGNFTICQGSYNFRNRDGGQKILLKILRTGEINNIKIHRRQVQQLLRVLNTIRKRYYQLFFQRCTAFGVPENVAQQIFRFLELIHEKALSVRASMNGNNGEESQSDSQQDSQEEIQEDSLSLMPEDVDQSQIKFSYSIVDHDSDQRQYDRDDSSDSNYPGSGDGHSSC